MNINKKNASMKDGKAILSTLWIFVTLNYFYGDLGMMIFNPAAYERMAARMTEGVILGASALMEVPMAMILLSRILKHGANRWANIAAAAVFTAFVALTLLGGKPPAFYIFLSI